MGYSTRYEGVMKFSRDLTGPELAKLSEALGEDRREHEWPDPENGAYWNHVDLELTADFGGLQWNDAEKTGQLEQILRYLDRHFLPSDVSFTGQMLAQGEDITDRYRIVAEEGLISVHGEEVGTTECPECGHRWES